VAVILACIGLNVLSAPMASSSAHASNPIVSTDQTIPTAPRVIFKQSGTIDAERTPAFFIAGSRQTIQWACTLSANNGDSYTLTIAIYTAGGGNTGYGFEETCELGNTSGVYSYTVLYPGLYKLDISTDSLDVSWSVTVTDYPS